MATSTKKRASRKPTAPVTANAVAVSLNTFVDRVADSVAKKLGANAPQQPESCAAHYAGQECSTPRPTPATTAEVTKVNHERASALLCRLVALNDRLRNIPPTQTAQAGQATTAGPGLNDFLAEEGSMLIGAHEALSAIGQYLGIEV
jgi:hypothetical protein